LVKDFFPEGAIKIVDSMVEGDFFKVNSNFAEAEEGTCMFLKEKEAPIEPPKPLTEAEKSAKPPTNLIDK
jgi:hypothetical protein